MFDILNLHTTSASPSIIAAMYTVLLAFLLSTLIAVTYERTFRGLSYSRNFVQALVLASMVAATVLQAIGDSVASGLGMLGALAIIRFRTNLKDPRDIIFMFASLASGIACGINAYNTAVVGSIGFCVIAFVLYYSPFGRETYFDGLLRYNIENDPADKSLIEDILNNYCKIFALITLRDMAQGKRLEYAYHVKLKRGKNKADFIEAMNEVKTIKGVDLRLQESTVEL